MGIVKDCGSRIGLKKHSSKTKCKTVMDKGRGRGLSKIFKKKKRKKR